MEIGIAYGQIKWISQKNGVIQTSRDDLPFSSGDDSLGCSDMCMRYVRYDPVVCLRERTSNGMVATWVCPVDEAWHDTGVITSVDVNGGKLMCNDKIIEFSESVIKAVKGQRDLIHKLFKVSNPVSFIAVPTLTSEDTSKRTFKALSVSLPDRQPVNSRVSLPDHNNSHNLVSVGDCVSQTRNTQTFIPPERLLFFKLLREPVVMPVILDKYPDLLHHFLEHSY